MKEVSLKSISIDGNQLSLIIDKERFDLPMINVDYRESKLFSYLEIRINNKNFQVKGLKSIWEHFNISTYDVMEKREDNKVYNLYRTILDIKNNK